MLSALSHCWEKIASKVEWKDETGYFVEVTASSMGLKQFENHYLLHNMKNA